MSDKELKKLVMAMDGLFGACDNLNAVCHELLNHKDRRLIQATQAVEKARKAISDFCTLTGTEPNE